MTEFSRRSSWSVLALTGILTLTLGLALTSSATAGNEQKFYQQHNLVSDIPGLADHHDPNLVNPWGLAHGPASFPGITPFWVADNHTEVATVYNGVGQAFPLVVTVPGRPTGIVFNGTSDFPPAPSFIFATEAGTIASWNPCVPPPPVPCNPPSFHLNTTTVLAVDNSASGAIYKGLAIGNIGPNNFLYAANFHAGTIDVFDGNFDPVSLPPGAFSDPKIPDGYAPFNIQNLGGQLYVAYAKQDENKEDEEAGKGKGFVDVFNPDGTFVQRVASRSKLNAPWGLTFAPDDFGRFSDDLLIGNFGDGRINTYSREGDHFHFHGQLQAPDGHPVEIEGLWALAFGNGTPNNGPTNVLFFTAGIEDEEHGLFGTLTACKKSECGNP
jgi:uncharacterized protein (TIGR03118 family)